MTVIKTFLTQQGTPLRSSAIGLRLGLHGFLLGRANTLYEFAAFTEMSAEKSGQRDVEGVFIKQFTKTIDCGAQPGCDVYFDLHEASCSSGAATSCAAPSGFIAEMRTPVGVRIPQARFELHEPNFYSCFFYITERSFALSGFPDSCLASRCGVPTLTGHTRGSKVSHQPLTVSVFLLVPFCRKRSGESVARDLRPQGTIEEGESQWTDPWGWEWLALRAF